MGAKAKAAAKRVMYGTINRVVANKGYGFVACRRANGQTEDIYFHASQCNFNFSKIQNGSKVQFVMLDGRATQVELKGMRVQQSSASIPKRSRPMVSRQVRDIASNSVPSIPVQRSSPPPPPPPSSGGFTRVPSKRPSTRQVQSSFSIRQVQSSFSIRQVHSSFS